MLRGASRVLSARGEALCASGALSLLRFSAGVKNALNDPQCPRHQGGALDACGVMGNLAASTVPVP